MFKNVFPHNKEFSLSDGRAAKVLSPDGPSGNTVVRFQTEPYEMGSQIYVRQEDALAYAAEYIREVNIQRVIAEREAIIRGRKTVSTAEAVSLEFLNQQLHFYTDVYTHEMLLAAGTGEKIFDNKPFSGQD